jgi:hypothetical protein
VSESRTLVPSTIQCKASARPRKQTALTFEALQRRTQGLSGPVRAEIFYGLPARMQAEAWRSLAEQIERERGTDV